MAQQQQQEVDWSEILASVPYPMEAFAFVREGLNFAVQSVHEDPEALPEQDRHISGQQLCMGLRDYAIRRYGRMAITVLGHWQISRTEDFGRMVFAMIGGGLMSRSDDDTLDDFVDIYEFDEAFSPAEIG